MVGDPVVDDFVVSVSVVDQKAEVLTKANTGKHSSIALTDANIYCFDVYNGHLEPSFGNSLGATNFFSPLAMLSYERGKYIFAQIQGNIMADNEYNIISTSTTSQSYGLIYLSSTNKLVNVIYYASSMFTYNEYPIYLSWYVDRTSGVQLSNFFPNIVLFGNSYYNVVPWYILNPVAFYNSTMDNLNGGGSYIIICRNTTYPPPYYHYFWYQSSCYLNNCPSGTFMNYTTGYSYCAECNSRCQTCNSLNNCITCATGKSLTNYTDEYNATSTLCQCNSNSYDDLGTCTANCNYGFYDIYNGACEPICPNNNLAIGNWQNQTSLALRSVTTQYVDNTGGVLQFSSVAQGLKLAAPTTLTADNFPNSFTMTLWVYPTDWQSGVAQFLVQAFGYIYLWKSDIVSGYSYPTAKIGGNQLPDPTNTTLNSLEIFTPFQWTFIGITKRKLRGSDGNDYVEIYLAAATIRANEVPPNPLLSGEEYSNFQLSCITINNNVLDARPQQFQNFIIFGGDIYQDNNSPKPGTSFDGYLREFALTATYMSVANLVSQKYRVHSPYSPDLLVYWHFNEQATSNLATLIDYTLNNINQEISSPSNSFPRLISMPPGMTLPLYLWNELYTCRYPLLETFPTKAGDPMVYYSIVNGSTSAYFDLVGSSDIFQAGDEIRIMDTFCNAGYSHIVAKTNLFNHNSIYKCKIFLDQTMPFSLMNRGQDYAFCLYSSLYDTSMLMSWIYIAQLINVTPQQFNLYLQAQKNITYQSYGGDDGLDNQLFFAKTVANIANCNSYQCRNISRQLSSYSLLNFSSQALYMGNYSVYWRPIYSSNFSIYTQLNNTFLQMVYVPTIYFSIYFFLII